MTDNLKYFITAAATIIVAVFLSFVVRKLLTIFIKNSSGKIKADPTNFSFIKNSVSIVIYTAAVVFIFLQIPYLKSFGTAVFAGAGIMAAFIGFASQKAVSNIVTGIFILIFKPFRVGDIITFSNNNTGTVEEITLRHTVIKDFQNQRIIIPNSIISDETILNSDITDEKIRRHIIFTISYESDLEKAVNIIAEEAEKHPNCTDNRTEEEKKENVPVVPVIVLDLNQTGVVLRANVWSENASKSFELKCDLLKSVKLKFDKENIEIAYPHRVILNK